MEFRSRYISEIKMVVQKFFKKKCHCEIQSNGKKAHYKKIIKRTL